LDAVASRDTPEVPVPAANRISTRALARIAGGLYVLNIVLGAFAIGAAESLPGLFRLGVAAHVVVGLTNIPLAVIFYELFRVVSRRLALLDVFFILVATAIEMAFVLVELSAGKTVGAAGYDVSSIFFAFYDLTIGYLVFRSTFMPRAVGVLMVLSGLSYMAYGFADILAPGFAALLVPWIQVPSLVGEGSLALTLLIVGVNGQRWLVARHRFDQFS
jgi:hypothetical protein